MRILLVEPDLEENGAIRVSLDRAQRWSAAGAEVTTLFVSDHDNGSPVTLPAGPETVIANKGLRSARWMIPSALAHGWRAARRADVIVAGREIASGLLIGTLLAKLARRPLAVTVHSDVERALGQHGTPRHRRNVLACLGAADLLTPVSQGLAPGLRDLGLSPAKVKVVENGLDVERLQRMAAEQPPIPLPDGPFVMGVGRLTHQKGFDTLIKAHAGALRSGAPPHQLLIAGEGPDQERLTRLAEDLGVQSSVTFAGFLANPYPILSRAAAFVLTSRWEGFSLALGEAMALNVPSISTDCISGPAELLDQGRYGDLVAVEDVDKLSQAVAKHLHQPARLAAMAREGQIFVSHRYGAGNAAAQHLEVLQAMADHGRLAGGRQRSPASLLGAGFEQERRPIGRSFGEPWPALHLNEADHHEAHALSHAPVRRRNR